MATKTTNLPATVDDLYRVDGKAELVGGGIICEPPTGYGPNWGAGSIYVSLRQHRAIAGGGVAVSDNCAFLVDLPNRQSFSPDAAWFSGPTTGMKFLEGAPDFAADTTVDPVMLAEAGLIRRSGRERVKVLGNGEVPHALMLKVHAISESARAKIEAKGGRVEILGAKQQDAGS